MGSIKSTINTKVFFIRDMMAINSQRLQDAHMISTRTKIKKTAFKPSFYFVNSIPLEVPGYKTFLENGVDVISFNQ